MLLLCSSRIHSIISWVVEEGEKDMSKKEDTYDFPDELFFDKHEIDDLKETKIPELIDELAELIPYWARARKRGINPDRLTHIIYAVTAISKDIVNECDEDRLS